MMYNLVLGVALSAYCLFLWCCTILPRLHSQKQVPGGSFLPLNCCTKQKT